MKFIKISLLFKKEIFKNLHNIILRKLQKRINTLKFNSFSFNHNQISKISLLFSNNVVEEYTKLFPELIENIILSSEQYLNNKFYFLGAKFEFSDNIDWHYDPKDKKRWIIKKYDEKNINYNGSPKDVKIVWELNRHQYFFTLAKAYILTKDEKYSRCIVSHIKLWIEQNSNFIGINWSSPLEISIRLISWIFAIDLIKNSEIYQKNQNEINKEIYKHIIYLYYHLSNDRLIHTNHLIGELTGIIFACMIYDFPEKNKILHKSLKILEKEIKNQIFSDGVSKEQSASYHRFVIDFLTLVVNYSKRFEIPISERFFSKLEKMIDYVYSAISTNNHFPMYGDSDNGRGFVLAENKDFWDFSHILSNGIILFKKEYYKTNLKFNEESYWLFGFEGKSEFDRIKSFYQENAFHYFKESGHFIYKNYIKGTYFFVRGGVFGMGGDYFSSHSHFDILSPIIDFNNVHFIIDSGTFVYNGDPNNRNKFRGSSYHNNITWNEIFVKPKMNFGWEKTCDAKIIEIRKIDNTYYLKFVLKKVKGYERSFLISNEKIIINDFFKKNYKNLLWHFHLHPDCQLEFINNSKLLIKNKNYCLYFYSSKSGLEVINSEVSFNYGEKTINKCIILNSDAKKNDKISFTISINDLSL